MTGQSLKQAIAFTLIASLAMTLAATMLALAGRVVIRSLRLVLPAARADPTV